MPNLTCPGCGSVYPLAGAQGLARFACSVCHATIMVPVAGGPGDAPPPVPLALPRPIGARRRRGAGPVTTRARPPDAAAAVALRDAPDDTELDRGAMAPLRGWSYVLVALYSVGVLLHVLSAFGTCQVILYVHDVAAGLVRDLVREKEIDAFARALLVPQIAVAFAIAAVFIVWFHRAHANLHAARLPRIAYGSGWAIGGFFVPVLNFVRPFAIMKEVWAGTACLVGSVRVAGWKRLRPPAILGWWWTLWLATSMLATSSRFPGDPLLAGWLFVAADLVAVVLALVSLTLVRHVTDLQDRARSRV